MSEQHDKDGEGGTDGETERDEKPARPLTPQQQALVRSADGLVPRRVAWHVSKATWALHLTDELAGAGDKALSEAARRYSPKFGTAFKTYARYPVDGAILDTLRHEAREHHVRLAAEACIRFGVCARPGSPEDTIDAMVDDEVSADRKLRRALNAKAASAGYTLALWAEEQADDQIDPERRAALTRLGRALRAALGQLPARDQEMLACIYEQGMDLAEVAERFHLAYPTVKARHAKLLGKLWGELASQGFSSSWGGE